MNCLYGPLRSGPKPRSGSVVSYWGLENHSHKRGSEKGRSLFTTHGPIPPTASSWKEPPPSPARTKHSSSAGDFRVSVSGREIGGDDDDEIEKWIGETLRPRISSTPFARWIGRPPRGPSRSSSLDSPSLDRIPNGTVASSAISTSKFDRIDPNSLPCI